MSESTTLGWTATGVAGDVRAGRRTAVDSVTESLARIREYDDDVAAFQVVRRERALTEAAGVDARHLANLFVDRPLAAGRHATVGVGHDEDSTHSQQVTGQHERSQHVVRHAGPSIADDLGVSGGQPQCCERIDARINARDDREASLRPA